VWSIGVMILPVWSIGVMILPVWSIGVMILPRKLKYWDKDVPKC